MVQELQEHNFCTNFSERNNVQQFPFFCHKGLLFLSLDTAEKLPDVINNRLDKNPDTKSVQGVSYQDKLFKRYSFFDASTIDYN